MGRALDGWTNAWMLNNMDARCSDRVVHQCGVGVLLASSYCICMNGTAWGSCPNTESHMPGVGPLVRITFGVHHLLVQWTWISLSEHDGLPKIGGHVSHVLKTWVEG